MNHWLTSSAINIIFRIPSIFFPHPNIYLNYPDAVHYQRGIQNSKVRNFEAEINIPRIMINGVRELDYELIQRIWWAALEIVEDKKEIVNVALEMRLFKGSEATLAPECGYDYVCSVELLRSFILDTNTENAWKNVVMEVFNAWKDLTDSQGNKGNFYLT
jgi:hypothetical protein